MELVATLVAVGFALSSRMAAFRWIERATAERADPGVRRAKLGFFLAFAAIFVLLAAAGAVLYAARPYGHLFAGNLAAGTFLAGLVPLCHWGALAQIRAMGLNGEGPVILSPGSRRRIRLPLIGGNLMGVLAAVVLIWFGAHAGATRRQGLGLSSRAVSHVCRRGMADVRGEVVRGKGSRGEARPAAHGRYAAARRWLTLRANMLLRWHFR